MPDLGNVPSSSISIISETVDVSWLYVLCTSTITYAIPLFIFRATFFAYLFELLTVMVMDVGG